ncbi:MAG: DUF2157 domain-containing protein [Thiomargarita sp.]|nr:DUF2157 domain-containing protein [Thiomargarita sp.]
MPLEPSKTPIRREHLYALAEANYLTAAALEYTLKFVGFIPDKNGWRRFLDYILLLLGATLLLSGIVFFFAYNWADMEHLIKFATLEVAIFLLIIAVVWQGVKNLTGQVILLAVAVLLGVLLAVYGQTYQTGADAFGLFLIWAILIMPWVFISCFAPLWLLLLVLLNLSLILYWNQVVGANLYDGNNSFLLFALLAMFNGFILVIWEYAYQQNIAWIRNGYWLGFIIFAGTLMALFMPAIVAVIDFGDHWKNQPMQYILLATYLIFIAITLWYYHFQRQDLLFLASNLLSLIVIFTIFIAHLIPLEEEITWLILAILVIAQVSFVTKWLLAIAKIWQQEENNYA